MKRVLFITNIASPYRVQFFDALGKDMDVTVLLYDRTEQHQTRTADWFVQGEGGYHQIQLQKPVLTVGEEALCLDVIDWLKKPYDAIVVCGYSSPTAMLAMAYLRLKKIPFYIEVDGGLIREDSGPKYWFKKLLVGSATYWISSGKCTTKYLVHYGAKEDRVFLYPFTSLKNGDILPETVSREQKLALREQLGIREENVLLSIGRFIPGKGFDVLMKAAAQMEKKAGIYIVGGEPTEEYLQLRDQLGLTNVHFVGFKKKEELALYYQAADLFVLPTRSDVWGLVINEAMAYGLPIITTDRCVAGLELVEDGVNGYIVPVDAVELLAEKMDAVLNSDLEKLGCASLEKIRPYTVDNMAKAHVEIFHRDDNL